MSIAVCRDLATLRATVAGWHAEGLRVGLVPTMGALHAGHRRLIAEAGAQAERVVTTIFVNPAQFAPGEDFSAYPRSIEADCAAVAAAGGDLVYAPGLPTMYPDGFATTVSVGGPALAGLEDRFRPTHFAGVATVVAKLLARAQADVALFGEKDFQQLRVIERMALDLDLPTRIVGVPTVREPDGLALSSRNVYLGKDERTRAPVLHAALALAAQTFVRRHPSGSALAAARRDLESAGFAIDYVEARHARDLAPLDPARSDAIRLLAAARLGRTRLIDNVGVTIDPLYDR